MESQSFTHKQFLRYLYIRQEVIVRFLYWVIPSAAFYSVYQIHYHSDERMDK